MSGAWDFLEPPWEGAVIPGESYRDYCFQANPQVESVDCLEGLIAGSPGVEKKVIESGLSPKGKGRRVDPQPKIQNLLQLLSLRSFSNLAAKARKWGIRIKII